MADISGYGNFGQMSAVGRIGTPVPVYSGPPNINFQTANAPIVIPGTGMMTQTFMDSQMRMASDIAAIKKSLGLT